MGTCTINQLITYKKKHIIDHQMERNVGVSFVFVIYLIFLVYQQRVDYEQEIHS